jgi:hypothetical protein
VRVSVGTAPVFSYNSLRFPLDSGVRVVQDTVNFTRKIFNVSTISFAMLQARNAGASIHPIATRLQLSESWVEERIEAARLCLQGANALALDQVCQ